MPELIWIVAAVMALTLIQVLLFQYLRGNSGLSLDARGTDGSSRAFGAEQGMSTERPSAGPEDGRLCADCGAVNAADFTFCRNCVSRLGS